MSISWLIARRTRKTSSRPYQHLSGGERSAGSMPKLDLALYGNRPRHPGSAVAQRGLELRRARPEPGEGLGKDETDIPWPGVALVFFHSRLNKKKPAIAIARKHHVSVFRRPSQDKNKPIGESPKCEASYRQ